MTIPPITGVSEIVLSVKSIPLMRKFYRDVLGFPVVSESCHETEDGDDPDGEPTICFLKISDVDTPLGRNGHPQLMVLIEYHRHIWARKRLVGHDRSRSTLNHLAFEIPPDAYEAHKTRLQQIGLDLQFSEFPSFNARAMFFTDPETNQLELICYDSKVKGL